MASRPANMTVSSLALALGYHILTRFGSPGRTTIFSPEGELIACMYNMITHNDFNRATLPKYVLLDYTNGIKLTAFQLSTLWRPSRTQEL